MAGTVLSGIDSASVAFPGPAGAALAPTQDALFAARCSLAVSPLAPWLPVDCFPFKDHSRGRLWAII